MSIVLLGSTSGSITLQEPAVAGTTVLDLPATSGTVALTASPTFTGTATIPTATVTTLNTPTGVLATQNGMTGIAKAWVQFAGASGTIAGSFNISSITRASAGQYTVNFTTAMPNANYCAIASASTSSAPGGTLIEMFTATNSTQVATAPTTSSFQMACLLYNASAFQDPVYVNVAVFSS
jgi:hypothetical protein